MPKIFYIIINRVDDCMQMCYNAHVSQDILDGGFMEKQIKSKSRVSDFGEVYTAKKQVTDMVDLVNESASDINTTVLEPACGNGNFLVEILSRKLNTVRLQPVSHIRLECNILRAVSSIYGVDIQKDNTEECRDRLYTQVVGTDVGWSPLFRKVLRDILQRNIMCGDTLTMMAVGGNPLTISEWDIRENGAVVRKDVLFSDMIANGGESTNYIRRYYYRWMPEEERLTA